MNTIEIRNAIAEAERFLDRARDALNASICPYDSNSITPSKESGALRRASMDLTRALADMRRP